MEVGFELLAVGAVHDDIAVLEYDDAGGDVDGVLQVVEADDGLCHLADVLGLAVEVADGGLEGLLAEVVVVLVGEVVLAEGHFHGENVQELLFAALIAVYIFLLSIAVAYGAFRLYDLPVREWLKKKVFKPITNLYSAS